MLKNAYHIFNNVRQTIYLVNEETLKPNGELIISGEEYNCNNELKEQLNNLKSMGLISIF